MKRDVQIAYPFFDSPLPEGCPQDGVVYDCEIFLKTLVPVLFGCFSPAVHFIPIEESGCSFPSGLFYSGL